MYIGDNIGSVMLKPTNFDNSKHKCLRVYMFHGQPVVLMVTRNVHPTTYSVIRGFSCCDFLSFEEAVMHCRERGYKLVGKVD